MVPENAVTEEQVKAAWNASVTNSADFADADDQIRVFSTSEEGGPSRPVVVTCGKKQILTTLETPALDCTESLLSLSARLPLVFLLSAVPSVVLAAPGWPGNQLDVAGPLTSKALRHRTNLGPQSTLFAIGTS